ncbi:hypothetical protein LTR86_005430 [Recurvomyces mirabilis]|nr:hypothetical protein LTR86_005430 [Recurvomyces mirabilis]
MEHVKPGQDLWHRAWCSYRLVVTPFGPGLAVDYDEEDDISPQQNVLMAVRYDAAKSFGSDSTQCGDALTALGVKAPSPSQLCTSCAAINLHSMFNTETAPQGGSKSQDAKVNYTTCALCRLVFDCLIDNPLLFGEAPELSARKWYMMGLQEPWWENHFNWLIDKTATKILDFAPCLVLETPTALALEMDLYHGHFTLFRLQRFSTPHVSTSGRSCQADGTTSQRNASIPTLDSSEHEQQLPSARFTTDNVIHPALLGAWAAMSSTHQASRPTPSFSKLCASGQLKLIDVQTCSLLTATKTLAYVALSYIWGTQCTPSSNTVGDGPLRLAALPRTIRDAFKATEYMGYRYLWVDAICIDHFNQTQKQALIAQMDVVYRCAAITIVAAAGDHSDSGLPGISPRLDSCVAIRDDSGTYHAGIELPMPSRAVLSSVWNTRGWTFQEAQLSRVRVYFTPREVVLTTGDWYLRESLGRAKIVESSALVDGWSSPKLRTDFRLYSNALKTYCPRRLSNEDDTVAALVGYVNALTDASDTWRASHLHHGLPLPFFNAALHWQPIIKKSNFALSPELGRAFVEEAKTHSGVRSGFPSWSWASVRLPRSSHGNIKDSFGLFPGSSKDLHRFALMEHERHILGVPAIYDIRGMKDVTEHIPPSVPDRVFPEPATRGWCGTVDITSEISFRSVPEAPKGLSSPPFSTFSETIWIDCEAPTPRTFQADPQIDVLWLWTVSRPCRLVNEESDASTLSRFGITFDLRMDTTGNPPTVYISTSGWITNDVPWMQKQSIVADEVQAIRTVERYSTQHKHAVPVKMLQETCDAIITGASGRMLEIMIVRRVGRYVRRVGLVELTPRDWSEWKADDFTESPIQSKWFAII